MFFNVISIFYTGDEMKIINGPIEVADKPSKTEHSAELTVSFEQHEGVSGTPGCNTPTEVPKSFATFY